MQFVAILHPNSAQARVWRSRRLRHGSILGVVFRRHETQYSTAPLEPEQVERLKRLHVIRIEMMTAPPAPPAPPAPVEPPQQPAPVEPPQQPAAEALPKPAARVKRAASKALSDDELFATLES